MNKMICLDRCLNCKLEHHDICTNKDECKHFEVG